VKTYGGYWRSGSQAAKSAWSDDATKIAVTQNRGSRHDTWNPWWFGCGCFV
jgi:hypothetical protein